MASKERDGRPLALSLRVVIARRPNRVIRVTAHWPKVTLQAFSPSRTTASVHNMNAGKPVGARCTDREVHSRIRYLGIYGRHDAMLSIKSDKCRSVQLLSRQQRLHKFGKPTWLSGWLRWLSQGKEAAGVNAHGMQQIFGRQYVSDLWRSIHEDAETFTDQECELLAIYVDSQKAVEPN